MIRLPGRTLDISDPEQVKALGLQDLAQKLSQDAYRGYFQEVQKLYEREGAPLVLSEGALRAFLQALDAIWEGKEPDLVGVQPSLRERVIRPLMDSATTRNWARAYTERVAKEFTASFGPVPAEFRPRIEGYVEDLWREVEKALQSAIILYQDESGQVYANQEDLIRRIVNTAHARLSAKLRLELLRM